MNEREGREKSKAFRRSFGIAVREFKPLEQHAKDYPKYANAQY